MRLVAAEFHCFRRLRAQRVDLQEDVIAVVGPNEAGKTTLLQALASLEGTTEYSVGDLTRNVEVGGQDTVVSVLFELNQVEAGVGEHLGGVGRPNKFVYRRLRNGETKISLDPVIKRDRTLRKSAIDRIEDVLTGKRLRRLFDRKLRVQGDGDRDEEVVRVLDALKDAQSVLEAADESLPTGGIQLLQECIRYLEILGGSEEGRNKRSIEKTRDMLMKVEDLEKKPHPHDLAIRELSRRRPKFLLFNDEERHLQSHYSISKISEGDVQPLENLLQLAGLSIAQVKRAMTDKDDPERASLQERANAALAEEFRNAWGQSDLTVYIHIDPENIHVHVKGGEDVLRLAERSDGLRAFVALYTFTAIEAQSGIKPILLIDEAERHLHYDAQADLVRVLEHQDRVEKIIYSTHSAGCLPSDLGTGIRVVEPRITDGTDELLSDIKNSFWTDSPGFSSLMLAMGASVMALVPTRRALIAEGPSDMMLLPPMLREACDLKQLDFQVAPGIASVSFAQVRELEFEAPRVAYVVDGDEGGDENKKLLTRAGVPESNIVQLTKPLSLEDLIDSQALVDAINSELALSHEDDYVVPAETLGNKYRMRALKEWCKSCGIQPPSKRRIAARLLELDRANSLVERGRADELRQVYRRVAEILEVEAEQRPH